MTAAEKAEKQLRKKLTEDLEARGVATPTALNRLEDLLFAYRLLSDMREDMRVNGISEPDKLGNIATRKVVSEYSKLSNEVRRINQELGFAIDAKRKAPDGDDEL